MTVSNEQDSTINFLEGLLKSGGDTSYVTDAQRFNRESSQKGPLRYFDNTMICVSQATSTRGRNCGCPTHYKLNGIPTCAIHCLIEMNRMLTNEDE